VAAKKKATDAVKKKSDAKQKISHLSQDVPAKDGADNALVAYEYERWTEKSTPKWHDVRKMRYVFWRMIGGGTVRDALRDLHWHESAFWNLVDLKRHAPFREEYKRAKLLQARAMADSVLAIAEGRDPVTIRAQRKLKKLIRRGMKRMRGQKSSLAAKAVLSDLLNQIDVNEKGVIARNKMQMDAAKWIAKTANPTEFGEKNTVALNGGFDGEGESGDPRPIRIEFVNPDGSVV
jgi:hypothetical protein